MAKPQPALLNMKDSHNSPDQSVVEFSLDSGLLWDFFTYDLYPSPPFLDENGYVEWQGPLTDIFDMSRFPDLKTQTWPEQYAIHCLGDVSPLQFATTPLSMADQTGPANPFQVSPASLATMTPSLPTSSPPETSNQSSSFAPHEERTPSLYSSTSSKTYICSICQPHRSYCKPQLLNLVSQLARLN